MLLVFLQRDASEIINDGEPYKRVCQHIEYPPYLAEKVTPKLLENTDVDYMISLLHTFNQTHEALFDKDRASLYRTFYIPRAA